MDRAHGFKQLLGNSEKPNVSGVFKVKVLNKQEMGAYGECLPRKNEGFGLYYDPDNKIDKEGFCCWCSVTMTKC